MVQSHHGEQSREDRDDGARRASLLATPRLQERMEALFPDTDEIERDDFVNKMEDPANHQVIWEWILELTEQVGGNQDELNTLNNDFDTLNQGIGLIERERDQAREARDHAQAHLDAAHTCISVLREELSTALRHVSPPASNTEGSKKSTKIPDPAIFSTGDHDAWEVFKVQLNDKLTVNEDHFRDEQARIAYVRTRLGGEALQIALPTSQAIDATAVTVIQALDDRFADPVAQRTARQNYNKLYQGNKDFAAFLGLFQKFAAVAKIPESQQVEDLREKLTPRVQDAIAAFVTTDLRNLIKLLHEVTRNLSQSTTIRNRAEAVTSRRSAQPTPLPSQVDDSARAQPPVPRRLDTASTPAAASATAQSGSALLLDLCFDLRKTGKTRSPVSPATSPMSDPRWRNHRHGTLSALRMMQPRSEQSIELSARPPLSVSRSLDDI